MKKFLFLCIFFIVSAHSTPVSRADEITYEYLIQTGKETGYCDHIAIFKKIFEAMSVKTMLEFGLGYSTKYFLDRCNKVISVEFITPSWKPDWIKWTIDLYREYSNWIPVAYFSGYKGDYSWAQYKYFGSDGFFKAGNHFARTGQSYREVDPSYVEELMAFITNLTKYNQIDLVLVDPGSVLRGEIIQMLFEKVPVIVTADTSSSSLGVDPYGFNRIKTPETYAKIYFKWGKGTTVWIQKIEPLQHLLQELKTYVP